VAPSFPLLLIQFINIFFRVFPTDFLFLLQCCLHHIFGTINSYINSIHGTTILIAAYSAIGRIFVHFSSKFSSSSTSSNRIFHRIFRPFPTFSPSLFCSINSSDKFARWCHHSLYSLFSLQTHLCAFSLIFSCEKYSLK